MGFNRTGFNGLGLGIIILGILGAIAPGASADSGWKIALNTDNSFDVKMFEGKQMALYASVAGWGPNWSPWFAPGSQEKATGDDLQISSPIPIGSGTTFSADVHASGPREAVFAYSISAQNDVPLHALVVSVGPLGGVKGSAVLTGADGSQKTINLPVHPGGDFGTIRSIALTSPAWAGTIEIALDPAMPVGGDGDLRIGLAQDVIKAGVTSKKVTWTFPQDTDLLISQKQLMAYAPVVAAPDWFAYQPRWDFGPSAVGMENWLDKPAGRHGGVRMKGDQFIFEDGAPIKFWGVCLSYAASAPSKEDADFTAARFAKLGVNAVRMHKFTGSGWAGIGSPDTATQMTPDGLDRLDYFASQLEQHGVYFGWSHSYRFRVLPGDRDKISGFDELMKQGGDTYAVINWAEDVQDLMIEMVVNLLKHKNPYTGKTYAADPALSYIELQNEDDIFFFTSDSALQNFPTYRRQLQQHFAQWLTKKYGSQDSLASAWGDSLNSDEQLDAASIAVHINPWLASSEHLPQTAGGDRQRILDTAAFLHYTQNKFYNKFVKAIRDAGYAGPLVGSPWIAPAQLPLYYNLQSDAAVGYVDRHNYFGGGFEDTMLKSPGGGYLSSGLQQVAGRPFGVSEWIHVFPSLYNAEGPVLMAAYGMGLQGWGASYEFQSNTKRPNADSAIVGPNGSNGVWNADTPTQLGQYPILSRMILRGDVSTGPVISTRNISPHDLENGTFNFADNVKLQGDVKTFTGTTPAESLAAGRDLIAFVDSDTPSAFPDMTKYTQGSAITAATGQLKWDTANDGVVTINTPGTQGYVGFAQGKTLQFDDASIQPGTHYASLLITAADPKESLASDHFALISAIARNANTGFRISTLDDTSIIDNGTPPILLEPVKAEIQFLKRTIAAVNILDADGKPTGHTVAVTNGKFELDTGRDRAIYYEVVFGR
jgi:hypothetical protein